MNQVNVKLNEKRLRPPTSKLREPLVDPLIKYAVEQLGARVRVENRSDPIASGGHEGTGPKSLPSQQAWEE